MYRIFIFSLPLLWSWQVWAQDLDNQDVTAPTSIEDTPEPKSNSTIAPATAEALPASADSPSQWTVEWGNGQPTPAVPPRADSAMIQQITVAPGDLLRGSQTTPLHVVLWKTRPEWFALGAGISTHGASAYASAATLRWRNVYWETIRFSGGAWKKTIHFFGSTMAGMPFWISARHEVRVGTGLSVGYVRSIQTIGDKDADFAGSGISSIKMKSYIMLPFEASYIYHHQQHLAFQVAMQVSFPLNYTLVYKANKHIDPAEYDADYKPFMALYGGFRF